MIILKAIMEELNMKKKNLIKIMGKFIMLIVIIVIIRWIEFIVKSLREKEFKIMKILIKKLMRK